MFTENQRVGDVDFGNGPRSRTCAGGGRTFQCRHFLSLVVRGFHGVEDPVMPVEITRIKRNEISWIDCRKVSATRAILVSSIVAISDSLVNGMGMIWREVSLIFTIMIQSSSGGSMVLFGKGKTSTEYFNASILWTGTRMLGRPLGNVRDSPQDRFKV
jgi:hypothetical protein